MPTIKTYNLKNTKREHGYSLIELMVVIIIIGVLSAVAIPAFMSQRVNAVKANINSEINQMVATIEASLANQDKEKLIVENGGKFPNISIDADASEKNGTITVGKERQIVTINNPQLVSYEILTDLDGYVISGYYNNGKDFKEMVRFDSSNGKIENIKE